MALDRAPPTLLLVDDDTAFADLLAEHLTRAGFTLLRASDGQEAIGVLKERRPDALLIDLQMPRMGGLEVVEVLSRQGRLPPTIVMSAFGSLDTALQAIRLGAIDFVSKPFRLAEAELKVRLALEKSRPPTSPRAKGKDEPGLEERPGSRMFHGMVGGGAAMLALFKQIDRVARFGSTVLVSGESGTGKELVARALHAASPRARGPFVAVNCGAIPANLLESELFGHVKGAFTDASFDRKGLFEEAHGGTLFLDEIVDLPLHLQVKLLRVLQENEIRRVGGNKAITVDVRVVAASAVPARQRVKEGQFREDLYYRLSVIELTVPPLRERRDDIPLLTEHVVERANQRLGTRIRSVHPQAMARLCAHPWPGNVRELQNCIEQACVMTEGEEISLDSLNLLRQDGQPASTQVVMSADSLSIPEAIEATERTLIGAALQRTRGNRTHAAELLAISPRNLQYKIKQYAIDSPAPVGRPRT
jgi:two-component system response regulator AtoC